jgi:ATP-dependent DNA helicase PIF1
MLLKNIDVSRSLVNGARGVVVGFEPSEDAPQWGALPKVAFAIGGGHRHLTAVVGPEEWSLDLGKSRVAARMQVPLKLAWAISIHKSQVRACYECLSFELSKSMLR